MNTPLNDALKPCPICNGAGESGTHANSGIRFAGCADIDCIGFHMAYDFATESAAIAAWNTRANTTESSAAQGAVKYLIEDCGCDGKERFRIYDQGGNGICYAQNREQAENVVSLLTQPSDATAQPSADASTSEAKGNISAWLRRRAHNDLVMMPGSLAAQIADHIDALANTAQGKPEQETVSVYVTHGKDGYDVFGQVPANTSLHPGINTLYVSALAAKKG